MKKTTLSFILIIIICANYGQTGPGGIGNSLSNGLWLKAGDITITNGSDISLWPDASGNGNNAFQTVVSEQPNFFSTSSINGQPVIRLNGTSDELEVADANILDGSSGITYYAIVRPTNLNGSTPRGILGKRVTFTVNTEYAYTWFFWSGNRLNNDIHTQNNRYNSGSTTFSNSNNYLLSFDFDGSLPASQRARMFSGNTKIVQSTESSTSLPNSNQPLAIGALNVEYNIYFGGDMAEIIQFNYSLDSVEHIIVSNYLSAKYDINLAVNDIYKQDDPSNGDYDFQVFGIGRLDKDQFVDEAQGDGIVKISNPSNLGNNEYFFAGHDNGAIGAWGSTDFPPSLQGRWPRVWRVTETNISGVPIDVGSIDISFNLSASPPVNVSHLALLIDTDNDGLFIDETPISGAVDLGSGIYSFPGVTGLSDELRFTIGTFNLNQSPLPVELISFEAIVDEEYVNLYWSTASEINNEKFIIERSKDGLVWEEVLTTNGSGNSSYLINYFDRDTDPLLGKSFYRLSQVDYDGTLTIHNTVPVFINDSKNSSLHIFPNPTNADNIKVSFQGLKDQEILVVLRDIQGKIIFSKVKIIETDSEIELITTSENIPPGTYIITASSVQKLYTKKVVIK